jgi:hypothetical protein
MQDIVSSATWDIPPPINGTVCMPQVGISMSEINKIVILADPYIKIPKQMRDKHFFTVRVFDIDESCDIHREQFLEASSIMMIFDIEKSDLETLETLDKYLRIISIYAGPYFNKSVVIVGNGDISNDGWVTTIINNVGATFKHHHIRLPKSAIPINIFVDGKQVAWLCPKI